MKKQLKFLLIFIVSLSFTHQLTASHLIGGEIGWRCLSNGKYIFYMNLYRDCTGLPLSFTNQTLTIKGHPSLSSITLTPDYATYNLHGSGNISPRSANSCQVSCDSSENTAIQLLPFTSAPITISGQPPSSGWVFEWFNCCRPADQVNLKNPQNRVLYLKAVMYPYKNTTADPCFDSSPEYFELFSSNVSLNSTFSLNHNAGDVDRDQLKISFDDIMDTNATAIPWDSGYSKSSPFPGSLQHASNVAASLNAKSGHISVKIVFPDSMGNTYAYSIKVDSYRDNVKIASVWRNVSLMPMAADTLNTAETNQKPYFNMGGNFTDHLQLSVWAGDSISIPITALDSNLYYSDPADSSSLRAQKLKMQASAVFFSRDFSDELDCKGATGELSPCATLSPSPTRDSIAYRFLDSASVGTVFNWNTSCEFLKVIGSNNSYYDSSVFNFVFNVSDDNCPPEVAFATLSVKLIRYIPEISHQGNTLFTDSIADSYQWFYMGVPIPNSDTNVINIQQGGVYSLEVSRAGCTSKRVNYRVYQVGIENQIVDENIHIYPNPFNESFTIELSANEMKSAQFSLKNVLGEEFQIHTNRLNENKVQIETEGNLPAGVYLLHLKMMGETRVFKVLKL